MIGIDLGTTSSCAAYLEEGKTYEPSRATPHVIEASRATPSMVAISGDNRLVGTPAKEQVNHTCKSHDPSEPFRLYVKFVHHYNNY